MNTHLITAPLSLLLLTGCATMAPLEFNPDEILVAKRKIPAELKTITVRTASERERSGKVDWFRVENTIGDQFLQTSTGTGIPIVRQWEAALADAVSRSILFQDDALKKVSLTVDIMSIEMHGIVTVTWNIVARYRIYDRADGTVLYERSIVSEEPAHTSEAFVGAKRARLAFVRSVSQNITLFLRDVESAGLQKPNQPP